MFEMRFLQIVGQMAISNSRHTYWLNLKASMESLSWQILFCRSPRKASDWFTLIECSSLDQSLLPQGCTLWFTSSCTHSVARSSLLTSGMYYSQCYLIRRKSGTPNRHKQQIHITIILKCHLMEDNNLEQKLTKHRNTNSGIGVVFLLNNLCQYL